MVEVVSLDSISRDRGEKYAVYEAAGVREDWIVDPLRQQAEFHRLEEDGRYRLMAVEDGVFASEAVPGFKLQVDWFWRRPLPKILDAAAELGLLEA